jgi:putative acetyltransferase
VHAAAVRGERGRGHYTDAQIDAWARPRSVAELRARIGARRFWIAESPLKPVGYAQLDPAEGILRSVYVRPEYWRRGVGRRLTDSVLRDAHDCGLQHLELDSSLNAVVLYEALGFVSLGGVEHEVGGVSMPCVRMSRDVGRGLGAP